MKKRIVKVIGFGLLGMGIFIFGVALYIKLALPNVGEVPVLSVESTPERLIRGKYLVHHVALCVDCHSERDMSKFSGPIIEGTWGKGGEKFDVGVGVYYAPNITPAAIGNWTDGELMRAITTGVSRDGRALFPVMPHPTYGQMDEEDIKSIIAYVRSFKPVENLVTKPVSHFPMNFIINTIPQKANFKTIPDKADVLSYGKYLVNAASCTECHSPRDEKGNILEGMDFAGGNPFPLPDGSLVRSANITQDTQTGIGNWTKDQFFSRFRMYADPSTCPPVEAGSFNTIMPWSQYAGMSDEDLNAVYVYLKSLKPVKNNIVKFTTGASVAQN
jgi:mono/diheme cytochrome c family protein